MAKDGGPQGDSTAQTGAWENQAQTPAVMETQQVTLGPSQSVSLAYPRRRNKQEPRSAFKDLGLFDSDAPRGFGSQPER